MNRNVTKIILPVLIFSELMFCFFAYKSYDPKYLKENKIVTTIDRRVFSIYKEIEDGSYIETKDTVFPKGYILNNEKTNCIDNNGNKVNNILKIENNELVLISNKTVFCYLYFDLKGADIEINVSTNGLVNTVPTTLGYVKEIICENGTTPTWDYTYNRLEFTHVNSDETICELKYTRDTKTYKTLISEVEKDSEIVHETFTYGDYSSTTTIGQSDYTNTSMYYSTSSYSSSGTSVTNAFNYNDTLWKSIPANLTSEKFYHLKMYVTNPGYYEFCYNVGKGHASNALYLFYQDIFSNIISVTASTTSSKSGCVEIGYLNSNNYIRVVEYAYSSASYGVSEMSFYLKKTNNTISYDAGYRYEGINPNNYVWFNNEMWRIIGSIPTKTASGTKNLIKLIRKNIVANTVINSNNWYTSAAYNLLNNYYYGKINASGTNYCLYRVDPNVYGTCDFSVIGIDSNGVYGNMIERVYWNYGVVNPFYDTATEAYRNELKSQYLGHVGLMSASDYGFATTGSHETKLSAYNSASHASNDWLYGQGGEWFLTKYDYSADDYYLGIQVEGNVHQQNAISDAPIRPVIYLNESVYIVSGSGIEADPYQIAMK